MWVEYVGGEGREGIECKRASPWSSSKEVSGNGVVCVWGVGLEERKEGVLHRAV